MNIDFPAINIFTQQTFPVRTAGVVYHNTNSTPILVVINMVDNGQAGLNDGVLYSDSNNPPTSAICGAGHNFGGTVTIYSTISAIILPNNYYELVFTGSMNLGDWVEYI
jgi:hypothetical protein